MSAPANGAGSLAADHLSVPEASQSAAVFAESPVTSAEAAAPNPTGGPTDQTLSDHERTANTVGAEVAGRYGAPTGAAQDPNVVTSGLMGSEAVVPGDHMLASGANAVAADLFEGVQESPDRVVPLETDVQNGLDGAAGIDGFPPAARWPANETATFTPDASLDLVDDIEFAFEQEDTADDAADASRGWVQGDGSRECPETFPIKGNGTSHIYHMPGQPSYGATIAERCFATEQDAIENGFRATKRNRPSS